MRRLLVTTLLAGAFGASFAAPANACVGTQHTVGVCTANRTVYSDCVYTGGSGCTPVDVTAPVCVYGWIGDNLAYTTAFC